MLRSRITKNTIHDIDQNDHEDDHTDIDIHRLAIFGYPRTLRVRTGVRRRTFAVLDRLAGFLIVITAVGQKRIPRIHNESLGIISQGFPVILSIYTTEITEKSQSEISQIREDQPHPWKH